MQIACQTDSLVLLGKNNRISAAQPAALVKNYLGGQKCSQFIRDYAGAQWWCAARLIRRIILRGCIFMGDFYHPFLRAACYSQLFCCRMTSELFLAWILRFFCRMRQVGKRAAKVTVDDQN
jgi:hypothetical protein